MLVDRPLTATNNQQQPSLQGRRNRLHAIGRLGSAQFGGVRMPSTNVLSLEMLQLGVDRESLLGRHRSGVGARAGSRRTALAADDNHALL